MYSYFFLEYIIIYKKIGILLKKQKNVKSISRKYLFIYKRRKNIYQCSFRLLKLKDNHKVFSICFSVLD